MCPSRWVRFSFGAEYGMESETPDFFKKPGVFYALLCTFGISFSACTRNLPFHWNQGPASALMKKSKFAGRSASRRMK